VGLCAVFVQGVLFRWIQPRLGEKRLAVGGLGLLTLALAGIALARHDWLMYPVVGLAALGSGVSIPSLTALVSRRVGASGQGRLMGGSQALLSLTMIIGPTLAGLSFEFVGVGAPYWLGSVFAATAGLIAWVALRPSPEPIPITSLSE
jgi:MFS family permease